MFKDASEALAYIDKEDVALVDVRFCDLPGVMQHFTIPVSAFKDDALTNSLMFDGSSIRGFQVGRGLTDAQEGVDARPDRRGPGVEQAQGELDADRADERVAALGHEGRPSSGRPGRRRR